MKYFKIKRSTELPNCTIGKLFTVVGLPDDTSGEDSSRSIVDHIGWTIEKPWDGNKKNISCVPPGWYDLEAFSSSVPGRGVVIALSNPELGVTIRGPSQRTEILFHILNFPHETDGCIGPGMNLHPSRWGVSRSSDAMEEVMRLFRSGFQWLLIE